MTSDTNGSLRGRVVLCENEQIPPTCCGYSQDSSGLPLHHIIAVIFEKYGSSTLHRFISSRHLTNAWKAPYEAATFPLPNQCHIDDVMMKRNITL